MHREHRFWKIAKSVHDQPESLFTIDQNRCSRSIRITVHLRPEYAFKVLTLVAFFILIVVGCSERLEIVFINNTAGDVLVFEPNIDISNQRGSRLKSGQFKKIGFPNIQLKKTLLITIEGCEYIYDFIEFPEKYYKRHFVDNDVVIQIESNLYLYLVTPESRRAVDVTKLDDLQENGYPIPPVKRKCGKA